MFKDVIGVEVNSEFHRCRLCRNEYNTTKGWSSLRRHFKTQHPTEFDILIATVGPPSDLPHRQKRKRVCKRKGKEEGVSMVGNLDLGMLGDFGEVMEREIKTEVPCDEFEFQFGGPSACISPSHPDLQSDTSDPSIQAPHEMLIPNPNVATSSESHVHQEGHHHATPDVKPSWGPTTKSRSIVWDHIIQNDSYRASCKHCPAEFQIKGGTSALLRHLKTIHPAAINFDPENPPPVTRRKRKKEASQSDYTIVTDDTRSYMDNLLEQFLIPDENVPQQVHHQPMEVEEPIVNHASIQSRADSEIDEVIRTLAKETAQNGGEEQEPDQDIRRLLGIGDQLAEPQFEPIPEVQPIHPDEEKQVSSSSSTAKKRKAEETSKNAAEIQKNGKMLSLMCRPPPPPPPSHPLVGAAHHQAPPPPCATSSAPIPTPAGGQKYNQNAAAILDFEAKVLYNQSMHSAIAREDAMTHYYRMKSRKLELEIKKLEQELGETSRPMSPIDEHDE